MTAKTVVAFDLYGTLLSTESIVKQLEKHCDNAKAQSISALWRRYQLEYTWRLNSMGRYEDFSAITRNSLRHALADNNEQLSDNNIEDLMQAYDSLSTFSDVNPALTQIAADPTIQAVIFSNGTKTMMSNSVLRSKDLSPHASIFQDIVTVDEVKQYKPSKASYEHLAKQTGHNPLQMSKLWLISGNPFDIVGARATGMQAIWVDRIGTGWKDAVAPDLQPTAIVHSLEQIVNEIHRHRV
jgi:2-haloacid dehalogenase